MDQHDYRLSVDFGTSNTVAVLGHRGGPRPLLFDGSPTLPSAVFLDTARGLLVGRDAERSARTSPDRFEPNPKRRVDEPTVLLGDAEIPVVELVAAVLRRVAAEARRVAGGPPRAVTLTYPAAWASTRRQVLVQAAQRAGIPPTDLVPEPVAAARSFLALAGAHVPVGASIVIYDLGAGTFDASVVRRGPAGFDVVAAEGLNQAGGLDIDAAIVAYLAAVHADRAGETWSRLLNPVTAEDRRASRQLWDDVRTAKEQLSRASQTVIHVPLSGDDVPLGREQLERLARPILDGTIATTRAALNNARVDVSQVAGVFLVGGGSRIPLVSTLLHQAFTHAPAVTEQPELAVAEGGVRGLPAPATPAYPAQPISAQPAYPPPVQPPYPQPAFPVSAQPAYPVSAPAAFAGPPPSGAAIAPVPVPGARRGRGPLVAVGVVLAVVLVLGVVALVVILRPDGGSKDGADPGQDDRSATVNRVLHDVGGHSVILTTIAVVDGKLRVNVRYQNKASTTWGLACPGVEEDLRASWVTVAGRRVYPDDSWCVQTNAGRGVTIAAGQTVDSWGRYPVVPAKDEPFTLDWYNLPTADSLTV